MSNNNHLDVDDEDFIAEMQLWVLKQGAYPLELITFLQGVDGNKLVAIPQYVDNEITLFLGDKSYATYKSALSKVGSLMDAMNYQHTLNVYKSSHPLSCPSFFKGFNAINEENPYKSDTTDYKEFESGKAFKLKLSVDSF